jgi:hypothetical protein
MAALLPSCMVAMPALPPYSTNLSRTHCKLHAYNVNIAQGSKPMKINDAMQLHHTRDLVGALQCCRAGGMF